MKLKSFQTDTNNTKQNLFQKHISDEQFQYMLEQGFEKGSLDCYAKLDGYICYRKHLTSSLNWDINIYITENGIDLDHDYDCEGNSSNWTWWFEDGDENPNMFTNFIPSIFKITHSFEDAWNGMIDVSTNL